MDFKQYLTEALQRKQIKRDQVPQSEYITITPDQFEQLAKHNSEPIDNLKLSSIKCINRFERPEGRLYTVTITDTKKRKSYQCVQWEYSGAYMDPFTGMETKDKDGNYRLYSKKIIDSTVNAITDERQAHKRDHKRK